ARLHPAAGGGNRVDSGWWRCRRPTIVCRAWRSRATGGPGSRHRSSTSRRRPDRRAWIPTRRTRPRIAQDAWRAGARCLTGGGRRRGDRGRVANLVDAVGGQPRRPRLVEGGGPALEPVAVAEPDGARDCRLAADRQAAPDGPALAMRVEREPWAGRAGVLVFV